MKETSEENEVDLQEEAKQVVDLFRRRRELRGFPVMLAISVGGIGIWLSTLHPSISNYLVFGGLALAVAAYRWGRPISEVMTESADRELSTRISSGGDSLREALVDLSTRELWAREMVEEILRCF